MSEMVAPVEVKPLRICKVCGQNSFDEKGLVLFVKNKNSKHGRENFCLNCRQKYLANLENRPFLRFRSYLRKCRVCGCEVTRIDELELFVKSKNKPYERDNLCVKCSVKLQKPKPTYLRKCRMCGLEAHTKEELLAFKKRKIGKHGRDNVCKSCHKKGNWTRLTLFEKRQIGLIIGFSKPITCYFCGDIIKKLSGLDKDSLIIHSFDGNHDNWNPLNKGPAHRGCHIKYHSKERNIGRNI